MAAQPRHACAQLPAAAPAGEDVFNALKDDPELAEVFEDVKANGVAALQK
jgi:hypothetical protein